MTRKIRSDSKLNSLPGEQRAKVNRWLFDKGMTYVEVVEACEQVLGLKVSRSSVARYYERVMLERLSEELAQAEADQPLDPMFEGMSNGEKYDWLMRWMLKQALELVRGLEIEPEPGLERYLPSLVRVLIAARRENNEREMVRIERTRFEIWAAKECLKHVRKQNKPVRKRRRKRTMEDIFGWEDMGHRMERVRNAL